MGLDVVLIVGRPGSGKSTLSRHIAQRWPLPVVAKDAVKELLFDTLGVSDADWSMKLGRASFAVLDYVIELQLQTGHSFLIDSAYDARYENAKFQVWQQRYGFRAVQVHCTAPPDVLTERFIARAADGTRHPGHADSSRVDEFRRTLTDGRVETLDLDGPVLTYESDTEHSTAEILDQLQRILGRRLDEPASTRNKHRVGDTPTP
ncbi:AAA family ATPase [Leifsonia sp. EB34]|uniref:AAA family ATPase n=1 Tax=Leifsonia sp. EB34 TaxID=3156303 RepID=UPI0035132684